MSNYQEVINKVCNGPYDSKVTQEAHKYKLNVMNVTWEDTGRFKGSCVGPNITDMTLQVEGRCMPVIRYDNFSDVTADISPHKFFLLVGNEKGQPLKKVSLYDYLKNFRDYMTNPSSWPGSNKSLIAENRDSHVLVSAQACFLPIPANGKAIFNPTLYNYQSVPGDPAVLAILSSREGTSATILGRTSDNGKLFFNENGQKASFTGQRKSEFLAEKKQKEKQEPTQKKEEENEDTEGLNMVLLIQVPLKPKNPRSSYMDYCDEEKCCCEDDEECEDNDDVEDAVIGHGEIEGPFNEVDNIAIERDTDFPIRVTIQFYKATSNGVVSPASMLQIASQINRVYQDADYVGSLVTEGETNRPTEYTNHSKVETSDWWKEQANRVVLQNQN